ncbi:MAG: Smr/MutS family protein [Deltaproteobacteria bacterium]|nr:Smr/MutS family protein [Deltaproteobacteria bacterium]
MDLIFARARYASVTNAIMPEFVPWQSPEIPGPTKLVKTIKGDPGPKSNQHPGSTIWIRGARHPLLNIDSVVPTDLLLDDETFIILITGPNTGGKTVSLKTTGLMVLMAQSGLHLPAIEAKLTVFENVFADIGDEQSIEQNLSTFSGHVTNIVRILDEVNERSLILLDELGSGTDPAEGAALAQAIVSYLMDKGATTFVATHFPELKLFASQTPGATNASLLFDLETLIPTFEMSIGMPGRSNALAIGRRLGMDETILDDALALIGAGSSKAESMLDSIYEIREKINSQEAASRLALKQTESERIQLAERLLNINNERNKILEETRRQAEAELELVRKEIRKLRKKLKDTGSVNQLKKLRKQTELVEEKSLQKLSDVHLPDEPSSRPNKPQNIRKGDTVLVSALGVKGQVVSLDKHEAVVAVGRLHMRARIEELVFKKREEVAEPSETVSRRPYRSPGMELDMRGQRIEEGVKALEQYLDSAFLANLPWVRIIHGKGTGRLGLAVRKALTNNSHVMSWEQGRDGEGGAGVTIAKLVGEDEN